MTIRVAINGYGRIGRNVLRAHYEGGKKHPIEIVAINDLGDAKINAHLTQHDTAHGRFPGTVSVDGDSIVVNGDRIKVFAQRDPAQTQYLSSVSDVLDRVFANLRILFAKTPATAGHYAALKTLMRLVRMAMDSV